MAIYTTTESLGPTLTEIDPAIRARITDYLDRVFGREDAGVQVQRFVGGDDGPIPVDPSANVLVLDGTDHVNAVTTTPNLKAIIINEPGTNTLTVYGDDTVLIAADDQDNITVTGAGKDTILGGQGNDTLTAGTGEQQLLEGGEGDDLLRGGSGALQTLLGGLGNDTLIAGTTGSSQFLDGGEGNDSLVGGAGPFGTLEGGAGNDTLVAGFGSSPLLDGGAGDDSLVGGAGGPETLRGGLGNDTLVAGTGTKVFEGEDGSDSATIALAGRTVVNDSTDQSGVRTITFDNEDTVTVSGVEQLTFTR